VEHDISRETEKQDAYFDPTQQQSNNFIDDAITEQGLHEGEKISNHLTPSSCIDKEIPTAIEISEAPLIDSSFFTNEENLNPDRTDCNEMVSVDTSDIEQNKEYLETKNLIDQHTECNEIADRSELALNGSHSSINQEEIPTSTSALNDATESKLLRDKQIARGHFILKYCLARKDVVAAIKPATGKPYPLKTDDIKTEIWNHVSKIETQFERGSYTISKNGTSPNGVIDLDAGSHHKYPLKDAYTVAHKIQLRAQAMGLQCFIVKSRSGLGLHLWFFFDKHVEASTIRHCLLSLCQGQFELQNGGYADVKTNKGIEVFPKQNKIKEDGYGNLIYLPWCFSRAAGQSEFFDLETGRILEPDELVINSVALLEPWKTTVENRTKPKAKQPSLKPVVGCLDDLKELSTKCTAMNELLSQSETPPSSANGMGNSSRLRLAQISKHIGIPDAEIIKLFLKQPNYKEQACLTNIRSIDISLPPPNCKNIATDLGFCDGKCSAITKLRAGTPIALLATKEDSAPITQSVTTSNHKTYATFITKFDGDDLRLYYDTREVILSCERGSGEKSQTIETKISNFYFEVKSQRTTMNNGRKQRRLLLAVHGRFKDKDWNTDVEVESDIYSTPRDLLKYIEKHVGPIANTYAPCAAQVLKTLSSELASDVETDLLLHGGVHDQKYILGNYEITRQEIIQSPVPLTLASEFPKTAVFNFTNISKEEAYTHLKNFILNSAGAYHRDTWPISITTVALNFAIQSRLSFASDVRCGFEIAGDQGKGKTEYCLTMGSFYAPEINEETLWHLKETPASLEALAPYFNGSPFFLNDIKNVENPAAVAEQYQNLIDGAAKTKMVEGRPTTSPTFKGLVILNGQEALSAHSSSPRNFLQCNSRYNKLS
jgi:hypothetical protein